MRGCVGRSLAGIAFPSLDSERGQVLQRFAIDRCQRSGADDGLDRVVDLLVREGCCCDIARGMKMPSMPSFDLMRVEARPAPQKVLVVVRVCGPVGEILALQFSRHASFCNGVLVHFRKQETPRGMFACQRRGSHDPAVLGCMRSKRHDDFLSCGGR